MQNLSKIIKSFSIWQILVIGFVFRLVLINQSFWLDEASQAMTSYRSLKDILFNNQQDFHPPFMYILTHFWIMISNSEIWLRLLPVVFGVLTIYFGYLIAKEMFSKQVGLLFALLLSFAPYHIYYSQEFRMYSLVTLLVTLSMYFFVCLVRKKNSITNRIGFILSSVLILYTHYLGGTIFLAQLIYLLLYEKKYIKEFFIYYFTIGFLFLLWIPQLIAQLQVGGSADQYLPGWSQMLSLSFYKSIPLLFVKFIIGRLDFNNTYIYISLIIFAFSVIGVSLYPLRKMLKNEPIRLILLWLFIPILFTFIVSFKLPMFQPFRLLFCLPAFLLLVAVGINSFKNGKKYIFGLVFILLIFCQSIFWFQPVFWREDWRSAVYEADQFIENGGTVLFAWSTPFPPYEFYSQDKKGYGVVLKNPGTYEEIDTMMSNKNLGNTIVLFDYLSELTDPQNNIKMQLESRNYKLVETKDYGGVGLVHYYR